MPRWPNSNYARIFPFFPRPPRMGDFLPEETGKAPSRARARAAISVLIRQIRAK